MFSYDAGARYGNIPSSVCELGGLSSPQTSGVVLEWEPPTRNSDGSSLNDLAAYRIDWGSSNGDFTECVWIDNAEQSNYVFGDLLPGSYRFVMVAVSESGVTSAPSGILFRSVQ